MVGRWCLAALLWVGAGGQTIACYNTPIGGPMTKCVTQAGVLAAGGNHCCFKLSDGNGSLVRGCTGTTLERHQICSHLNSCGTISTTLREYPAGSLVCACVSDLCNHAHSLLPILYSLVLTASTHALIR